MMREMVRLALYEDGTYEVKDTDSDQATQRLYGVDKDGRDVDVYYCRKDKWEWYLSKLLNSKVKDIDKEIKILQKKKKEMEKLKNEVLKNLEAKNERETES